MLVEVKKEIKWRETCDFSLFGLSKKSKEITLN